LLVFVVLYLGVLATVYRLKPITRTGQRVLPGLSLACPLLFAPAAYFLFGPLLFPTGASVVIASVIEPFPSGPYAKLSLDLGMFTRQKHGLRLDFDAVEPGFLASHRERRWGTTASYSVDESSGRSLETAQPGAYVLHMLQAQDVIVYDVKISARRTDGRLQLTVRNNTGQSWLDAWLVSGHSLYRLGALNHNDGAPLTLDADAIQFEFPDELLRLALENLAGPGNLDPHLTRTLLTRALRELVSTLSHDQALLVAIAPSPMRLAETNESWQQQGLTLVVFRFEMAAAMNDNVTS
jgi:hypothetical protein